jgi:competence ComEA-like helix-hairpin-helix protein
MNNFKSHFWYHKSQRNGIFFLALIIIILQIVYFYVDFSPIDKTNLNSDEIIVFQKEIDSLKRIELENRKSRIFPFNPSYITDFKGYQLGMSTEEIDKLLKHRSDGKYINSIIEFKQVTGISDSVLNKISPYFKFPDWVTKKQKSKTPDTLSAVETSQNYVMKDINSATAEELRVVNGIGEKLASRIINYRNKLGGFLINEQLFEVYYLDKEIAHRVLERFTVIELPQINKINVNEASFKEVLSIIYIDYELTKNIFAYRDEVAEIQSLDELKKIDGFPIEKFDRIALYLQAK